MAEGVWAHCGSCKTPIPYQGKYYACDISSCRKAAYCSLECFSMHTPVMRHKDAWATEKRAPSRQDVESTTPVVAARRVVPSVTMAMSSPDLPQDILIVASKLKDYIRIKSGMNTSANVLERLSDMVRLHCDRAIETARSDGRKTVMDRDFQL